ncbi:hypothetical protein HMSSN139_02070 [Paenibacillus sp. HMSSN-139]|nr:hypothetical protein HMSSN139_02070 [Paenibacillus sp. HMSSN-139]
MFYATNAYLANTPVELELVFEGGTLHQRGDCLYLTRDGQESLICEPPASLDETGRIIGKSYWGSSHRLLIADFYDHIRTGTRFAIGGEEGLKRCGSSRSCIVPPGRGTLDKNRQPEQGTGN